MTWNRQTIQNILFFAVFILFFALTARLLFPFFTVILWASILYVVLNPLYSRLSGERESLKSGKKLPFVRRSLSAALISVLAVVVIIVPLGFIGIILADQAAETAAGILDTLEKAPSWISINIPPALLDFISGISGGAVDPAHLDLRQALTDFIRSNMKTLVGLSSQLLKNAGAFGISLMFTLFTLYFFFMDGHYLKSLFVRAIPIRSEYMTILLAKFRETARQLVQGNLLVALIQGFLAFVLFLIFGIKSALLLSVLVSICSFIPLVGSALVWMPVSLWYVFSRSPVGGIVLLVLSALLISIADNFYRPFLVGGPIKLHPLPIFFAIVGGVSVFGINGLIIGPLILVMFFAVLDMFRDLYKIPRDKDDPPEETDKSKPVPV